MTPVLFVVAAALGGLCRWQLAIRLGRHSGWPVGTLTANLAGCFLAGLASRLDGPARTVVLVAALGSLTTFSTLAVEVMTMARTERTRALAYLVVSLVAGLVAVSAGLAI